MTIGSGSVATLVSLCGSLATSTWAPVSLHGLAGQEFDELMVLAHGAEFGVVPAAATGLAATSGAARHEVALARLRGVEV